MTDTFSRNLTISAVGHAVVLALIFVRAVLIPSEPIEIRRAIRVDVVDLPQKMTEEQMKAAPAPPPPPSKTESKPEPAKPEPVKAAPPKPDTVNLSKAKPKDVAKSQSAALAKLKALAALEKIKHDVSEEKKPAKPATVVKGNQVAAGNSLTGLDRIEYDKYFDDLEGKIRAQWSIPQWLADGDYKAQVQILVDERGYVTKKIMRRSSGNEVFDAQVMAAIDGSSPLPPPPARLQGLLSTSGIILNFPE
jgi:colicin import membrane protein